MRKVCSTDEKKNKKNWTTLTVIVVFWLRADRGAGPGGPSIKMAYTTTTTKQRRRRIRYDDSTQAKERVGGRGKHSNSFFTRCCAIRSKEKGVRMSVCVCVCVFVSAIIISISQYHYKGRRWGYCRSWATGPGPEHGRRAPIRR